LSNLTTCSKLGQWFNAYASLICQNCGASKQFQVQCNYVECGSMWHVACSMWHMECGMGIAGAL